VKSIIAFLKLIVELLHDVIIVSGVLRHLAYGRYLARHKWFVFVECLKLEVPIWHAVFHDWHKLLPEEWIPYAETFYNRGGGKQYNVSDAFTQAWNAHQKRARHHWQWWMITWDHGGTDCLEMSDLYRREMLADWRGAGRAILGKSSDTRQWYLNNRHKIHLHPKTREWVEKSLGIDDVFTRIAVEVGSKNAVPQKGILYDSDAVGDAIAKALRKGK
jgi:hypothetical protein